MKKRLGLKKITLRNVDEGELATVAGGILSIFACGSYSCGTNCNHYSCPITACDCVTAPQFSCHDTCGGSCYGSCDTCNQSCGEICQQEP
jgi:hypothetical protein